MCGQPACRESYALPEVIAVKEFKLHAYITLLGTDGYLPGVLALAASLKSTQPCVPLHVAVAPRVSEHARQVLLTCHLPTIRLQESFDTDAESIAANLEAGVGHWSYTFDKLWLFELTKFEKLVYLDCDMLILHNVDELFDRPHMSAVIAGQPAHPDWSNLNSGLMVIEPESGLGHRIFHETFKVTRERLRTSEMYAIGDQDLLQTYYRSWPEQRHLHLDHVYNSIVRDVPASLDQGYNLRMAEPDERSIKVLHFAGFTPKPWLWTALGREFMRFVAKRERDATILRLYWAYRRRLMQAVQQLRG